MSEALKKYRELKSSNPFAAANFRQANAASIRAAEEAERPEEHALEVAERQKQIDAAERERTRAHAGVDSQESAASLTGLAAVKRFAALRNTSPIAAAAFLNERTKGGRT